MGWAKYFEDIQKLKEIAVHLAFESSEQVRTDISVETKIQQFEADRKAYI